jgi:RimJ/RimL family protein N-acetyltransferase
MNAATIFDSRIRALHPPVGLPAIRPLCERFSCSPIVVVRPLSEGEWDLVRAFIRRMTKEDLHLRFGHPIDFNDEATMRRFFDIRPGTGEIAWVLDETSAIAGISHRIMVSPGEAEIGLIVRSDRKRRGIGECLLRAMLARSARQGLDTLSAVVLRENRAVLRLAAKIGYVQRAANAFTVELIFALR